MLMSVFSAANLVSLGAVLLAACCFLSAGRSSRVSAAGARTRSVVNWSTFHELAEDSEDEESIKKRQEDQTESYTYLGARKNLDHFEYAVILDCGSSGTRAHIYHWPEDMTHPHILHSIEPMRDASGEPYTWRVSPGLSSFEEKPEQVGDYIKPVLDFIKRTVPAMRLTSTRVYALATAGMRLLDDQDQRAILEALDSYVKENYNFASFYSSVISGADEGMYRWISVNAKKKRFLSENSNIRTKTYAVIEMGGASTQITYQVRNGMGRLLAHQLPDEARDSYWAQVVEPEMSKTYCLDHEYKLHSTTFLGFGSNIARELYVDLLVREASRRRNGLKALPGRLMRFMANRFGTGAGASRAAAVADEKEARKEDKTATFEDPCLPRHFTTQPITRPRSLLSDAKKTLGFFQMDDDQQETFKFRLRGTANYWLCRQLVTKMIHAAKRERLYCEPPTLVEKDNCPMSLLTTDFIPFTSEIFDVHQQFLAIGEFYHTTNLMLDAAGHYNQRKIAERTDEICSSSYHHLTDKYPAIYKSNRERIFLECFKAVWIDAFLTVGLKMPKDYAHLETINEIDGDKFEWTLGAALDKSVTVKVEEAQRSGSQRAPELLVV